MSGDAVSCKIRIVVFLVLLLRYCTLSKQKNERVHEIVLVKKLRCTRLDLGPLDLVHPRYIWRLRNSILQLGTCRKLECANSLCAK